MDTASGVYLHITDSSFQTSGASNLVLVIPMQLVKGKIGMNDVDATTFKDVLGYDMSYNSNYYGLSRILEQVSHAYVWRLNQNAKLANAYFEDTTSEKAYNNDAETFEDITRMNPQPVLAIAHKQVGDWETAGVKFTPTPDVTTVFNNTPTKAYVQEIKLEDINPNEVKTLFNTEILASCIFYNSSDNAVVGALKKDEMTDTWKPYRVLDGELIDDVIKTTVTETNIWTDGTNFYDEDMGAATEPEGDAGTPVEIGTVRSYNGNFYQKKADYWYKAIKFSATGVYTEDFKVEDTDVITALEAASDITISFVVYTLTTKELVKDNAIGTASFDEDNNLTIIIERKFSNDTYWMVHTIPTSIKNWTMSYGAHDGRQYTVKSEVPFSFDVDSDIYIDNVDFGEIQIYAENPFPSNWKAIRDFIQLEGGSNGDKELSALEIDTDALEDTVGANVLLFNGLTDYRVVNRICNKAITKKIHSFVDVPAFNSYVDAYEWSRKIVQSQYVALGARPDQEVTVDGKTFYVYPSVNYAAIFANMINTYGSLNYPPAGATYGNITANDLLKCDYTNFANEMKTYRMNYQVSDANGTVMWEQRTTYNLNSDLSYIAPTFIVDDLADRIVSFERGFNFRYTSRTDLLNQESGLSSILDNFVEKGFLVDYQLLVPTYAEAQAAGRTLTIKIGVIIAKDTEVINLEVELRNSL